MRFNGRSAFLTVLVGSVWASVACSPSSGGSTGNKPGLTGAAGYGGDPSTDNGGASGSSTGPFGNGGQTIISVTPPSGTDAGHNNCGGPNLVAEREVLTVDAGTIVIDRPVALLLMLDQSGSMSDPGKVGGTTKWSTVVDGLTSFLNDSRSTGIDAALAVFPPLATQFTGTFPDCTSGVVFDTPLVPMGALPGNAATIINALNSNAMPNGAGTPTEGGLRGAENYCAAYDKAHPDEDCVVVFATDGQPSMCDQNHTDLDKIVSDARTNTGTKTFAIGMATANPGDVDFTFLNSLAVAGGTNCNPPGTGSEACNVGGGSDLTTALNTIRAAVTVHQTKTIVKQSALACQFKTPDQTFDKDHVNITFQDSSAVEEDVYQVNLASDCGKTTSKAWYFDNNDSPTQILLCPQTCSAINAGSDGGVLSVAAAGTAPGINVQLGCVTKRAIIQ